MADKTAAEIAQHYSAAMDSVNLINAVVADTDSYTDDATVLYRRQRSYARKDGTRDRRKSHQF